MSFLKNIKATKVRVERFVVLGLWNNLGVMKGLVNRCYLLHGDFVVWTLYSFTCCLKWLHYNRCLELCQDSQFYIFSLFQWFLGGVIIVYSVLLLFSALLLEYSQNKMKKPYSVITFLCVENWYLVTKPGPDVHHSSNDRTPT